MSRPWRAGLLGVALLAALAAAAGAQSQATTGVIEGTVVDAEGAVLPGATVTLRNTATNYEKVVTTDGDGRFRAPLLPLGPYRIAVALEGFATLVREGIDLTVGQTVTLRLELQLSSFEQEIVVTGEAPVVETTRTEGVTRIDEASVEGLPNNGRNFLDFAELTPGVTVVQGPDGDELSINGQKGIHNNVSVDGADFNNPFFGEQRGGQRPPFTFNLDAVKEVVVVADGAPAEFGRSSGGFVNVVTKSGTNDLHWSAHAFYQNDSLSSDPAAPGGGKADTGDSEQAQYGFTLGGPLRRDRLFYFLSADLQDADKTKQLDPGRIDPRLVAYFTSIGAPGENGPITRTNDAAVALAKLDWQASSNNLATLRYAYTDSEQVNGTFDVDSWGRSANAIEKDDSYSWTGSLNTTLSSNLLNELRGQFARENRPRPYNGPIIASTGRPLPDTAFDFVNAYRFGMPFFIPVEYYDERFQLVENLTWLRGKHTFKGGLEYNDVVSSQTFIGFANGRYIFGSTEGFLNFARNPSYVECFNPAGQFVTSSESGTCPAGSSVGGPVLLYLQQAGVGDYSVEEAGTQKIRQHEPALFLQDQWQPRSNLTVQYGLRWEAQLQPDNRIPREELFYFPFIGQTVTNSRGTFSFPSDGTLPDDEDMFQPRLGISWDPKNDGTSVVRATAGIFAARIPGLSLASTRSTNGSIGQTLFRNSALTPILGPVPAYPGLIPQSQIGSPFLPDVFVFDKDFKNPRTSAFSLSYESQFGADYTWLIKGNYAKTDHVTRFLNRNDPLYGSPWSTGLAPGGANGIATLTTVTSNAKSRYWGVTGGLTRKLSNTLAFQAYYTYSKDKSDDDNERDPFSFRYAKITDLEKEYGYSDRDQRHRANAWLLWQGPAEIDVNLRYSYRSAQPKSIKADGSDAATPADRINPDGSVTRRNLGRKDNEFNSLDLRLSRTFELGAFSLEPIVEVFNVFDEENFRRPEVTNLVFNFDGTVQSGAGDPRQIQFGLRVRH
ncbi:MAG TPA: TonB-dependent receptor [Thermoanaerobaculia bacterium]|nr:TonB-dependent receptor [Thermoanaerobaculia bacterium]